MGEDIDLKFLYKDTIETMAYFQEAVAKWGLEGAGARLSSI